MFGSAVLETAIGLVFIYTLLSLLCSAVKELVAHVFNLRARNLETAIGRLLQDDEGKIFQEFYQHPLVKCLGKEPKPGKSVRPSYIPTQVFSAALIDIATQAAAPAAEDAAPEPASTLPSTADDLRRAIGNLPGGETRKALLNLVDHAEGDLKKAQQNIEEWFDNTMDRASGWYNRNAQAILLVIGVLVVGILDIDSIAITKHLWVSPTARQGVAEIADTYAQQNASMPQNQAIEQLTGDLNHLDIPLAWKKRPTGGWGWTIKFFGLLLTLMAISLGAPFWFEILKKIANVRTSVEPKKRPAEASTA